MTRLTWLPLTAALSLVAATASADTSCGASAIPNGSSWYLSVTSFANTVCDISFTNRRGAFSGQCGSYDEDAEGNVSVTQSTISGRLVINQACAVTGNVTVVEPTQSFTVALNGQLSAAGRPVAERPSSGAGVLYIGDANGFPVLSQWQMTRRAASSSFPRLPG